MEPAACHEDPGSPGLDDAVKRCWSTDVTVSVLQRLLNFALETTANQ